MPLAATDPANAACAAVLPKPLPVRAHTEHRGYRRAFAVHARGGLCQLQRVRVHIRYSCGGERIADYRQTYYEFFRFERDGLHLVDTHDFDLARDGWRQAVIVGLCKRHRAPGVPMPTGEAELQVKKQFTIAAGEVRADAGRELEPGASFGLLASGSSGPSQTRLRIATGDGGHAMIDNLPPCPAGYPVQGSGSFATSAGARALEHYRYRFATLTGRLTARPYRAHCIS